MYLFRIAMVSWIVLMMLAVVNLTVACEVSELAVGESAGAPGTIVEIEVQGDASCEVAGFSLAIGHDVDVLRFVDAEPSEFVKGYAGDGLFFHTEGRNDEGYAVIAAIFDFQFPFNLPPTPVPEGTVLATLRYEILSDAPGGPSTLLNRALTFGENPVNNIFLAPSS